MLLDYGVRYDGLIVFSHVSQNRIRFVQNLNGNKTLRFVGSFSPLVSKMIEQAGFEGIYVSGAVISSDLGLPDIELINLSELAERGSSIIAKTKLPSLADADTGFGGLLNVARTVQVLEQKGFSGLHLEDQKSPKKCGHLDNKKLIDTKQMCQKIEVALKARTDSNFLIVARTDARGVEGFEATLKRAKAYVQAGAQALFPEALETKEEFQKLREVIKVPLIANMTEFGKSELLTYEELNAIGMNLVLYPVTTWRWALKAVETGLKELDSKGSQKKLLSQMLTRKELYELLEYNEYSKWD